MNVVNLVIINMDVSSGQAKVLSVSKEKLKFPYINTPQTPDSIARVDNASFNVLDIIKKDIFNRYVDLHFSWTQIELISVYIKPGNNNVEITYGCMIPAQTKIKEDAHWLDINIKDKEYALAIKTLQVLGGISEFRGGGPYV